MPVIFPHPGDYRKREDRGSQARRTSSTLTSVDERAGPLYVPRSGAAQRHPDERAV